MEKIDLNIENSFDGFVEDLKELVRIPSVYEEDQSRYPFGENIDKALRKMLSIAEKMGFETYYDPSGYYGYAQMGQGDEMIGVLGHLDVVPAGDLQKWDIPPFEPDVKGGRLYGRGTQDDKGPMLAAMYALKAVADSGARLEKKVRFIYGTDEERLWKGISEYNKKERIPDYGFTPDANFPLIYAEKGLLQVDLVAESESGIRLSGGDAYNSVPSGISYETEHCEKLSSALESFGFEHKSEEGRITVFGKSVHAKDAEEGINPISRLMIAMDSAGMQSRSSRFIVDNVMEDAFATKIFGECTDEMSGNLKFNIGKIDICEKKEKLSIDMRIPVSFDREFVIERLEKAAKRHGFRIEENDYLRSIYTPVDSRLVSTLMKAYSQVTGDSESVPISSGGATYARAMDNCVAFGAMLPYTDETEHQPNENIKLDEMKTAMKIYSNALLKLLEG